MVKRILLMAVVGLALAAGVYFFVVRQPEGAASRQALLGTPDEESPIRQSSRPG